MDDGPDGRSARVAGTESPAAGSGLMSRVRRLWRGRNGSDALRDTFEELIEQEESAATPVGADELTLLRNVFNLRNLSVDDVMVPRADITAVEIRTPLRELAKLMSEKAHSRVPIYRETLDDVVGMVHIKDVLAFWDQDEPFELTQVVRRLLFVAPSMPILELLLQMRANRIHMALVVDEFGGTDGLVTIEDLVEELVGEIEDEHDEREEPALTERPDGTLEADARLEIEDFEARIGKILSDREKAEDIDTLGGLVFFLAGRVPGRGEVIRHESGVEFEILDADPRRIKRLRIFGAPDTHDHD